MTITFRNRTEAGQLLAQKLKAYTNCSDVIVLALPRGGVPVGFEIAKALNVPFDVCVVRKLGVPHHPELAMGAIAANGVRVLNYDILNEWNISDRIIDKVSAKELQELQRREYSYRENRPPLNVRNRTVILVDDGIATGSTIRAVIALMRQQKPKEIIVAVPVAPCSVCKELQAEVDKLVCLKIPEPFHAVGLWYENFSQTSDDQVHQILKKSTTIANAV
ncbi:phosphoribosyltransferase [Rivularia sp. UHCC 0363]|uniref:phosphoribosyltransferase n=1 Tax=Rivularia sp. UHCC 0363 TaxID=3110244 RepID=UPI002B218B65|nr:phosphoribosyltransferase [Rivularia sp. UHCC 0363]MEA5594045.1 phosphoribosyltransferase [Rivularia sp. UHCC 0363]